ncbi:MAG: porin family protein [Endomicrobium sp.]|jgi:opacity protein-like surface antigen|nr:porin family protein [Endomicrobium sp.]
MKNIIIGLAVAIAMTGAAIASEVNVKGGVDVAGKAKTTTRGHSATSNMNAGINITGEFLTNVIDIVKVGGGVSFGLPRVASNTPSGSKGLMLLPIDATVEANPISAIPDFFFKGNIGYGFLIPEGKDSTKSGLYYGVGAGYNFPFGLVVDVLYSWQKTSYKEDSVNTDLSYRKLNINVGYKFKL